jgi:hypothetical protein
MPAFGQEMASRRTPEDNAARKAIEESSPFHARDPKTLERHQRNTFVPFFRDRATMEHVDLGFTEITAANVQAAPQRVIGSLGALDPMGTLDRLSSGPTRWSTPSLARTSSSSKAPATFPTSRMATSWPPLSCHGWPSTPCEPRHPTALPDDPAFLRRGKPDH